MAIVTDTGVEAARQKLAFLGKIRAIIAMANIDSNCKFFELMDICFNEIALDEHSLATSTSHNITTVRRWIGARNAPHRSLWPTIIDWCQNALASEIDRLQQEVDCYSEIMNSKRSENDVA